MTAILTKQNVLDKAFVGGSGSGSGGDGTFDSLHVKGDSALDGNCHIGGDATVDGNLTITTDDTYGPQPVWPLINAIGSQMGDLNESIQSNLKLISDLEGKAIDHESRIEDINSKVSNHDSRITTLENEHADGVQLAFENGLDDFIIDINTLKEAETDDCNVLEILFKPNQLKDVSTDTLDSTDTPGSADVFEIIWPSNMSLPNTIIPMSNGLFNNPKVTFSESKYILSTIYLESSPKIYMSKDIISNTPMNLFTSGFMRINYIANMKHIITSKDNQIINLKCNIVDADNCFKLY